eukprot:7452263-Pyramimonas_sp.AAC.1
MGGLEGVVPGGGALHSLANGPVDVGAAVGGGLHDSAGSGALTRLAEGLLAQGTRRLRGCSFVRGAR